MKGRVEARARQAGIRGSSTFLKDRPVSLSGLFTSQNTEITILLMAFLLHRVSVNPGGPKAHWQVVKREREAFLRLAAVAIYALTTQRASTVRHTLCKGVESKSMIGHGVEPDVVEFDTGA